MGGVLSATPHPPLLTKLFPFPFKIYELMSWENRFNFVSLKNELKSSTLLLVDQKVKLHQKINYEMYHSLSQSNAFNDY